MNLKHFTKNGNQYTMKIQYGSSVILIGGLFAVAFGAFYIDIPALMWTMLVLGILCIVAIASKKLTIDLDKRVISAKVGLVKPAVIIPFDSIQNFEMYSLSQGFVQTNTALNVYYLNEKGKEKSAGIAQGFTKSAMQSILNEVEDILAQDERKGEI